MTEDFSGLYSDLKRPSLLCTLFKVDKITDLNLPNATIPTDLSINDKVLLFYEIEQAHSSNWIYKPKSPPKRISHNAPPYNSSVLPEILLFYLCSYCLLITEERKLIEKINTTEKAINKLKKLFQKLSLSLVHDISPKKVAEDLDKYLKLNNDCTITLELIKSVKEQITDRSSLLQPKSPCSADIIVSLTQIHDELELHYNNLHDQIQEKYFLNTPSLSQVYDWLDKEAALHSTLTFSKVNSQLSASIQDTSYPLSFCYVFLLIELHLFRKLFNKHSDSSYTISPLIHFYTVLYLSSNIEAWKQTTTTSRILFAHFKALLPFLPQTTNKYIRSSFESIDYNFRRKALFDSKGKLYHYFRTPLYVKRFGRSLRKYINGELKCRKTYIKRTPADLAQALGISRSALTKIMSNKNKSIDPDTFLAAISLGIPDLFLMGKERNMGIQSNGLRRAVFHVPPPVKK